MRLSYEFANVLGAVYHRGSIAFGPDGSSLYSPVGNKIILYDLKANKSNALPTQVNYNIAQICIHPKGNIMLAASEKSHLYMISLFTGRLLHFKEYKAFSQLNHISFSPDGRYYCVSGSNLVLLYITPGSLIAGRGIEIMPFRLLKKFRINHESVSTVTWSADSKYICVASQDVSLTIINIEDQDEHNVYLRGHTDSIISCYFANSLINDYQLYSLTKNCQLFIWDTKEEEEVTDEADNQSDEKKVKKLKTGLKYKRSSKHYLKLATESDDTKQEKHRKSNAYITSTSYNSAAQLLVIGYSTGHYSLYELPSVTLVYNFDSDYGSIDTISINPSGDWIVFGSSVDPEVDVGRSTNRTQSRLTVWEWQSKSHILNQMGSGATMANMHECVSFSLDGTHVVSGNLAGKIKVWNGQTGDTVAVFGDEHKGPIKAIKFVPNKSGKVIISASLDGTIRAYDLNRFKNFRTFQSPVEDKSPEFICLDVDSTGEFIAAGSYNYFEIYLYSLQTGRFLEYLTGHEGPVSGVAFSPTSNLLVSVSWDCTIRIWNLFEGAKCIKDTITLSTEIITVAFRPDGREFAVALGNGQIAFFEPTTSTQLGMPIEGAQDLGTTQLITEASRDSKKCFISLNYSVDGSYIIGGGRSNHICIYHTQQKTLIKKLSVTFNMSMDGVFDYVSNRKRSEFGFNLDLLDQRDEERTLKPIQLPGVRKGDLGDRKAKAVMSVYQLAFSPTMRSFAAATTEGVLIYSLDVSHNFDPYKLVVGVDPVSVRQAIKSQNYGTALVQSIQLNDIAVFQETIEKTPLSEIDAVVSTTELDYIKRALEFLGRLLTDTRHIEFHLLWIKKILYRHGVQLKNLSSTEVAPIVRNIHQTSQRHFMNLKRNSDFCRYSLEYLTKDRSE